MTAFQYTHHRAAADSLVRYMEEQPGVVAVILGGSVAKGMARPDSDIDGEIVVTPQRYAQLEQEQRLSECVFGYCGYEGGYFDLKYMTKSFIEAVAQRGSEPARNAFVSARCLWTSDPDIPGLIEAAQRYPVEEKADKMLSFYSALALNEGYFWRMSQQEPYLRTRAVADIVLFGLRLVLASREVLFPCQKSLMATAGRLPQAQEAVRLAQALLNHPDDAEKDAFVAAVMEASGYIPPQDDGAQVLTRYIADNEQWWYKTRPLIAEW